MAVVIRDSFGPDRDPRVEQIEGLPLAQLRQLAVSGSQEAIQELARRLRGRR